jgi:hypothetical protein
VDPSVRREWTAVEERWAVLTRRGEIWSGTLNAPVPHGEWWVAVTSWAGLEGTVALTLTEPSSPAHGSNLVTCEGDRATPRPKWVRMRPAQKDWVRLSATIRSRTAEPFIADRIVLALEIAWRST